MRCAHWELTPDKDTQPTHSFLHSTTQMSKQVLISMLAQGNTGSEILSILDVIATEQSSECYDNKPTADMIEF